MNRLEVRKGSLLDEGELLTTLSDNTQDVGLLQRDRGRVPRLPAERRRRRADRGASSGWPTGSCSTDEGVVETIEADFNNETGNIAFRATFPNPEGLLRHGETGNVS
jgi:membrane fusion protein (multidrug efflux system)